MANSVSGAPPALPSSSESLSPAITTSSCVDQTTTILDESDPNESMDLLTSSPLDSFSPQIEELPDPRHDESEKSDTEQSTLSSATNSSQTLSPTSHLKRPCTGGLLKFAYKKTEEVDSCSPL